MLIESVQTMNFGVIRVLITTTKHLEGTMNNNQEGLPIEAVGAIVSIIGIAWGLSWVIQMLTN